MDVHALAVPAALRDGPPADYALVAALYDPFTGTRLPATAPPGDGLVPLGTVRLGSGAGER